MEKRINIGYVITDSIHIGETEFVIGTHQKEPSRYVTWACKNGTDYYWGHYMTSQEDAERDLVKRARDQIRLIDSLRGKPSRKKDYER